MTDPADFSKYLSHLCSYKLLVIDDFCLSKQPRPNEPEAVKKTLLDESRAKGTGLIIASQINPSGWIKYFGSDAIAEAIVERIITKDKYFSIKLEGESMRAGEAASIPDQAKSDVKASEVKHD